MNKSRLLALALCGATLLSTTLAGAQRHKPSSPSSGDDDASKPTKEKSIELSLSVGENKTLPASDVDTWSVGDDKILNVHLTPDKKQFVIVGGRPGTTTLLLIKENKSQVNYSVTVFARAPGEVEKELMQLMTGYTGLKIRQIGARFFIEGGVSTEADAKRILLIASLYPGQVESLVVVGSVGVEHTINVRIDFYFVQYDKTTSYDVGVSWPGKFGGGALNATFDFAAGKGTAALSAVQTLPALDLAQTRGWAKVLKHTVVVTTSGSEATFENGGERNFPVATGITSTIQAIKFGTNVVVLPRYDQSTKDLEVKVNAQVSDLTSTVGDSLPGRATSTINTFVHLKLGQSLVLSGIRSSSQNHSTTGLPGLSRIPVLGLLFGTHVDSTDDIEGAVFIIPSVVDATPRRANDIVDAAMKQYEKYEGEEQGPSFPHEAPAYK